MFQEWWWKKDFQANENSESSCRSRDSLKEMLKKIHEADRMWFQMEGLIHKEDWKAKSIKYIGKYKLTVSTTVMSVEFLRNQN